MDFLWNGYGFRILKNMDYGNNGMDMDLVLNPSGPTACETFFSKMQSIFNEFFEYITFASLCYANLVVQLSLLQLCKVFVINSLLNIASF